MGGGEQQAMKVCQDGLGGWWWLQRRQEREERRGGGQVKARGKRAKGGGKGGKGEGTQGQGEKPCREQLHLPFWVIIHCTSGL